MIASQFYIITAIVALAVIVLLLFFAGKNKSQKLTPLAGLAFGFVLAGIIFGDSRLIGYSLMGVGVLIAIIDIFMRSGNEQSPE